MFIPIKTPKVFSFGVFDFELLLYKVHFPSPSEPVPLAEWLESLQYPLYEPGQLAGVALHSAAVSKHFLHWALQAELVKIFFLVLPFTQ